MRPTLAGREERRTDYGVTLKEYSYVLNLSPEESALLAKYRGELATATTGFAERFYNYLFDHPDIASSLYRFERDGGDVGQLARTQLGILLGIFGEQDAAARCRLLLATGAKLYERGIRPVWLFGAYNLLIDYTRSLLPSIVLNIMDRSRLDSVLIRLLLRDQGFVLEGYWRQYGTVMARQTESLMSRLDNIEGLLSAVPLLAWSVHINSGKLVYASDDLLEQCGSSGDSTLPCMDYTQPVDQPRLLAGWQGAIKGRSSRVEARMKLGDEFRWYRLTMCPDGNGSRPDIVHCLLEDVESIVAERRQLQQLTTRDLLTGLPNRTIWTDQLGHALAGSRRAPGSCVVVMALDINQFKMYNDTLGHEAGDRLLCDLAARLKAHVRESDSLARLGGDKFGIMLQPDGDARKATDRLINEIQEAMDRPFSCCDRQLCVSLTTGIACFPADADNAEDLLEKAEGAMMRARRNGLPYQYFDPANDVSTGERLRYSGQIRNALDNNEFLLHYQPQVDVRTSRISGAEALLRWDHPVEGIVMPGRIIPVAEQLGLITAITDWVMMTALRQCRHWRYEGARVPVSVNVSARSFQSPRLLERINQILCEAGVEGEDLELEITEETLMQDVRHAVSILAQLRDNGVRVAIDDFGTGYSSLAYLKHLPINTLKIDQSFITDVAFDSQDVAIVRSIIELGHNLDCKVVAEGVENPVTLEILRDLGCDAVQGFHFSLPVPDDHFSRLLACGGSSEPATP